MSEYEPPKYRIRHGGVKIALPRPREDCRIQPYPNCNSHELIYEDGSGYVCRHCGKDLSYGPEAVMPHLTELPEDIATPLISIQADARYLFARVAQDPDVASMMADSVLERLSQLETALYKALLHKNH